MGTVDRLLAEHVSFRCTSVDRLGIRGYIPGLQYEGGVVKFLVKRGNTIPSPAAVQNPAVKRKLAISPSLASLRSGDHQGAPAPA